MPSLTPNIPISTIIAAIANNFNQLFPLYWAQYEFDGSAPAVSWLYGVKALTKQAAPMQIVVFPGDESTMGSEVHTAQPSPLPRELSRLWTKLHFFCWGGNSQAPAWSNGELIDLGDATMPTVINQNGYWFQCTTAGTTGSTEPTWPTTPGVSVTDNGVVWTNMGLWDAFAVFDTDVTDLMRLVLYAAMHYTLVGNYKPLKSSWYEKTDLLVMDGTVNHSVFEVLIPVVDLAPETAIINSISLNGVINLLIPTS